jgi:hypothetical protein
MKLYDGQMRVHLVSLIFLVQIAKRNTHIFL